MALFWGEDELLVIPAICKIKYDKTVFRFLILKKIMIEYQQDENQTFTLDFGFKPESPFNLNEKKQV